LNALPVPGQQPQVNKRERTISALSMTSSAVNSLMSIPSTGPSRPSTPPLTSYFPPQSMRDGEIHPLLPPPYLANHLTVLRSYHPLMDSYHRVTQAKAMAHRLAKSRA
jgi:hypothetical protein